MAVMSMSTQEFSRLEVLLGVQCGRLRIADACGLIGICRRHVLRLLRGLSQDGASSLVSKRRGRRSNHRLPDAVRDLALTLVRERYCDFGRHWRLRSWRAFTAAPSRVRRCGNG